MPSYDYKCEKCGKTFEVFQKMSEEGSAKCPECGEFARRVLNSVGISFNGSGFYVNDSKKREKCAECAKNCPNAGKN